MGQEKDVTNRFAYRCSLFVLANLSDLAATLTFLRVGVPEAMPVPYHIISEMGLLALAAFKGIATVVGISGSLFAYNYPRWDKWDNVMKKGSLKALTLGSIGVTAFAVAGAVCAHEKTIISLIQSTHR